MTAPAPLRRLTRRGYEFEVEDGPITASWSFWDLWASEAWERRGLEALDAVLPAGGTLLDVGAWVGPWTLWAARSKGARVVALEPDPEAYRQLVANVRANDFPTIGGDFAVRMIRAAAALGDGEVELFSTGEIWGRSVSSMVAAEGLRTTVPALEICGLVESFAPDVVKMDVEGGEGDLLPAVGPLLRSRGIPLLLSLHPPRLAPEQSLAILAELALWEVEWLDPAQESALCRPRA